MNSYEIKIDYFSATFPLNVDDDDSVLFQVHEMVKTIATYLNVNNFEVDKAKYAQNNYNYQFHLGEYIVLRLDGPMNDCYQRTCHLEMKGEGCRDFERRNPKKTWMNFLLFMMELNSRFKRIDIAIDDFSGKDVTMGWILEKLGKGQYCSIFRSSYQPIGRLETGLTIQFGTTESPVQLVIYDKLMERKKRRKDCDKTYWVRYEMRFRNETAARLILTLCKDFENVKEDGYGLSLQEFAFRQLYRILDIKEDNNYDLKSQHKVKTSKRWQDFLGNVEKGELRKLEETKEESFIAYLKYAEPYVFSWLLIKYMIVNRDPYLFELEVYKFLHDVDKLSKKRFKRLNIFLDQMNIKTIDDATFAELKAEFAGIVNERELPF